MTQPAPWRVLEWLLAKRLRRDPHCDSTLGDLAEGFRHRAMTEGLVRARLWHGRQALSLLVRGSGAEDPRMAGRGASPVERAMTEARATLRRIARRPGFTLAATGVLAAAIAAAFAAFSVTTGTYAAARWWAQDERAVLIWPGYPFSRGQLDWLRSENQAFESIGGVLGQPVVVSESDRSVSTNGVELSTELFAALRARPVLGRGLEQEDGLPGAEPVVVLGHALWRGTYGGSADVLGRVVDVNGVRRRVVGVMQAGADQPGTGTELWMPLVLDARDADFWPARELTLFGLARRGVDVVSARDDVRRVLGALARRFPFFYRPEFGSDATVELSSIRAWGAVSTPLLLLLSGTGLLLLVAAIDVGNLALARSLARRVEMQVRVAIGASRAQVIREILFESALQAGLAGAAGWALGSALAGWLPGLFPFGTLVEARSATDPTLIFFVLGITAAAWALMAGVQTAHFLAATRASIAPRVRRGTARGLVVAQAALATVLMVSAALLLRTLRSMDRIPLGFEPASALAISVAPPSVPLPPDALLRMQNDIAARVAASPLVQEIGWISATPLLDPVLTAPVNREEQQVEVAEAPTAARFVVDEGSIAALGLDLIAGRAFRAGDDARSTPVVLVNRAMARLLWPDTDPVGRRIAVDPHAWNSWLMVVGVVEDMRYEDLTFPVQPAFFLPREQAPSASMTLVMRSRAGVSGVLPLVRNALADLAPGVPAGEGRSLASVVRDAQGPARVLTALLSVLAILATALGAVGLYGSLAGWVARRRTEIGTRLALGATPQHLSLGVLRTGLLLTGGGVFLGSLGAAVAGRSIRGLLFGVSPLDPMAFAVPALLLLGTAILAAAIPAMRAASVPPAQALRDA